MMSENKKITGGIKCRQRGEKNEIFDPVRKKWVRLTPEEQVRQYLIYRLIEEKEISISRIAVERKIEINGMTRRYDLVVFDREGKPQIVIECKAPHVKITQEVVEQAGNYNGYLHAPILGVSNGEEHHFFSLCFNTGKIKKITFF
ncbi:MAG: type I restriction enzyme HsdR N-terminal domain-containing protein [Bacteroidales bacterium]|jgi:hypothetical protein|nr:type I restriction enzyme HsdR N-terminal domain-containing protein [Bacteroidales bacterium]